MKRTLTLVVIALCIISAKSADETLYGAWLETWNTSPGAAKTAGEMIFLFSDTETPVTRGSSDVTIKATWVNEDQETVVGTMHGTWKYKAPKWLVFDIQQSDDFPTLKGKLNLQTGGVTGTFSQRGVWSGKFQGSRAKVTVQQN